MKIYGNNAAPLSRWSNLWSIFQRDLHTDTQRVEKSHFETLYNLDARAIVFSTRAALKNVATLLKRREEVKLTKYT